MASRRSNKSHKVPNVRLRPAPPLSSLSKQPTTASHDSGFESEYETSFVDTCPRPFRDVVLCATRIEDKTTIFKQAIELGAQSFNDLTDKVTHVLATEPGSAKYTCAVEFKLPIMHPSWITDSYEVWLKGDDVDFEESVEKHRLPIFTKVVLCITGINDEKKRKEIRDLVKHGDGIYVTDITRPVKVTHLICGPTAEDSEKVRYAKRFNAHREANIRIVWEEWFWDSLQATGLRDEEAYSIANPRPTMPEPGAPQPEPPAMIARRSQSQDAPHPPKPAAGDSLYDQDEEGPILAAPLPAVTAQAWEGMLKSRGFQRHGGNFISGSGVTSSSTEKRPRPLQRSATEVPKAREDKQAKVLASFRRTDSFAPAVKDASTPRPRHPLPFRRAATLVDITSSFIAPQTHTIIAQGGDVLPEASSSRIHTPPVEHVAPNATTRDEGKIEKKPLAGLTLRAVGEVWQPGVRDAVEKMGGRLVPEDSDEVVNYIVVRLVSGSKLYRDELDELERPKYRTECWLERCLHEERLCAETEHAVFIPLKIETPVPGAELIKLNYTGLSEEELCWVKRLSRVLGFNIPDTFSRLSTHLLCPSKSGVKFEKAQQWGVSVVDMSWLTDIAVTGVIASSSGQAQITDPVEVQTNLDDQRKGTEDHDHSMIDITNDRPSPEIPLPQPAAAVAKPADGGQSMVPNGLLGLSQGASHQRPPEPIHKQSSLHDNLSSVPRASPHGISTPSLSRQMSLADLRKDMQTTRIPSSETPSPVKAPSKTPSPTKPSSSKTPSPTKPSSSKTPSPTKPSSKTPSPVKLDMKAAADLLKSITSSVKRPSTDQGEPKRQLKRARPSSRSTSTITDVQAAAEDKVAGPSRPTPPDPTRKVFDPFSRDEAGAGSGTQDETMGIAYEDPAQETEKVRLIRLMGATDQKELELWEVDAKGVAIPETQGSSSSRGRRKSQRKTAGRRRTRS